MVSQTKGRTIIHLFLEVEQSTRVVGTAHGQRAISREGVKLRYTQKSYQGTLINEGGLVNETIETLDNFTTPGAQVHSYRYLSQGDDLYPLGIEYVIHLQCTLTVHQQVGILVHCTDGNTKYVCSFLNVLG